MIERRREQQNQPVLLAHQLLIDRGHGALRASRIGGAADHAPGLRDRVDFALIVFRRSERRAVVEIGAQIPIAVPGLLFERRFQRGHVQPPGFRALVFAARVRQRRKLHEHQDAETSRAKRFLLCRLRRRDSCRRSNRRRPSEASP